MPAPRETTYDIGGEKLILKATEVKTLGKVIEVLKKENTFLKAAVELEKKKADIQMRALKAGRLETEETKKRMVIVENIQKRVIAFYEKQQTAAKKANTETAKAIKPRAPRGPNDWIDTGGKPSGGKKKGEAPTGVGEKGAFGEVVKGAFGEVVKGMLIGIGFKLIGVIEKGISTSQHLRTVGDILTKTVGLLVDLILLPFLPLIVYFLMKFVRFAVTLGTMWEGLTKQLKKPLSLSITAGGARRAIVNFIAAGKAWLLKLLSGAGKYVLSAIAGFLASGAAWLLKLLSAGKYVLSVIAGFLASGAAWLLKLLGAGKYVLSVIAGFLASGAAWLLKLLSGAGKYVVSAVANFLAGGAAWLLKLLGAGKYVVSVIAGFVASGVAWLLKLLSGAPLSVQIVAAAETISRLREKYGMGVCQPPESFQSGGVIPGPIGAPRVVTVHGGERVVPAGKSVGDTTVNFYGYQDDKFVAKVKEIMRREGARYQV